MTEYNFKSMEDLNSFIEARKGDQEAHYYWGFIENYDNELYTIEDLAKDVSEDWFESVEGEEVISSVYEF